MKLSEKIVFLRKKRHISQEYLSRKMGVSRQTIYKWEADLSIPELAKIQHLAEVFNVSYDLLLDEKIDLNTYFNEKSDEEENNGIDGESKENKNKILFIILGVAFAIFIITAIIVGIALGSKDSIDTNTDTGSDLITDTDTNIDTGTQNDKNENMAFIYFDAKGGELDVKHRKVKINEAIGELPVPTKENFLFTHWENGNGIAVNQYTVIDADVILYAVYEDVSNVIHLTLNANGGTVPRSELDVKKGSGVFVFLPIPTHSEGKKFLGWFDEKGILVTKSSIYNADTAFTAYWDKLEVCPATKGEHDWDMWNYDKAISSCEVDGIASRLCWACFYEEVRVTEKAKGHTIDKWNYDTMLEWGECSSCGTKKTINYAHLKDTCIESTEITGNVYGKEYIYALYDGEFDSFTGPGCAEKEEMTIDIKLKESTLVDYIFTHGHGSMTFRISVLYQNQREFTEVSNGYFDNKPQRFKINGYISAIRIHTDNAEGHWQEIALAQMPEEGK